MDNYHRKYPCQPSSPLHPGGSAHSGTANSLRASGPNRPHIPSSIPTNTLSIVPTNSIPIRSINRQSLALSSPTHLHPDDPSSSSSPPQQSPDTDSPDAPALKRLPSLGDPPSVEPSSGAHRTLKSNTRDTVINLKAPKDDRERRKRNRVTPEQLVQLEAAFTKDRSPTSTERRELSNRIGMAERAVQIWFQNRSVNSTQIFHLNKRIQPSISFQTCQS